MVIEKNSLKASRFDSELSPHSRDTMSSEDEEFQRHNAGEVESDDEDEEDDDFDDCDSGAGSDDFDLLELGESREEFCQIGDQTCSIPFELYDLSGLGDVLSLDVWNEMLSEEERFNLAQYLPDMDQETFMRTLKDLLTGINMHFGSPIDKLFNMLKGGLCEPRVALYHQGLIFFQKRQHYHRLRNHQNAIVSNLCQIRDAWLSCPGYSIEEKLQVLNIKKNEKILMYEKMEEMESDGGSERGEEFSDTLWGKKMKDQNLGQKVSCYSGHGMGSALDSSSRRQIASETTRYKKQNLKGTFKVGGTKGIAAKGMELKYESALPLFRRGKGMGYDSEMAVSMSDQLNGDDEEDGMYEVAVQRERNFSRAGAVDKSGTVKLGKKHERFRAEECAADVFMGVPMPLKNDLYAYGRKNTVNQLSDIKVLTAKPSNARTAYDFGTKDRYGDGLPQFRSDDQINYGKIRVPNMSLKASGMELAGGSEPFWPSKEQEDTYFTNPSHKFGNSNVKSKKWKADQEYPDRKYNDKLSQLDYRAKAFPEKVRAKRQNGGQDASGTRGRRVFAKMEETEPESSEKSDEDEDNNPLMRSKWAYPSNSLNLMSALDPKKAKYFQKDKHSIAARDGSFRSSRMMSDSAELFHSKKTGNLGLGAEPMGKTRDLGQLNSFSSRNLARNHFSGPSQFDNDIDDDDDEQPIYKLAENGTLQGDQTERYHKAPTREKKHKGKVSCDILHSNYMQDHKFQEDDSLQTRLPAKRNGVSARLAKKGQMLDSRAGDNHEKSDMHLTVCNSVMKKRKVKDDVPYMDERDDTDHLYSDTQQRQDDISVKRSKKKLEDETWPSLTGVPRSPASEMIEEDVNVESRPQKKPFILITPTVHTGFSFSIVHLLSAVRMAMITLLPEEAADRNAERQEALEEESGIKQEAVNGVAPPSELDGGSSVPSTQANVPSLSVQEIVNRVKSNPGDPCILETQEPLHDLVRGVLKIFSSKTAPLGAKGWKPLVVYEKPTKSWSWNGPVSPDASADHESMEEVTSPEVWGLPHKMLVKLVDSFANWLKNGQETLRQIGSLPDPPLSLMQYSIDEKERFRDLRAQKSLSTIGPSSEEVREYFRKEEFLRYSIPDRAFSYTAIDGKKSIVAPLRRCGGKPTSKARDHFMLKKDRPAHVTILCLVRDAAARLPGSTGTRSDVCTLIRDSQYIVEEVSDAQVNQVVSGALDRLHYERDPCVQFDNEKKLWVYLHRDREEEDFEDDGTSSTKKWKRQKKEAAEPSDQGAVTVACHGAGEQNGFDLSSDLNVEPSNVDADRTDLAYEDGKDHVEDNVKSSHVSEQGAMHCGSSLMDWDTLCSTPQGENKLLCQQNSTNEDFEDETCGEEAPA